VDEGEEASASVFLNGQRLVMVAVEGGGCSGSGRGHDSGSYKGEEDATFHMPLMAAQSWKRRWPVVCCHHTKAKADVQPFPV
jgi:hypothetical protein